MLDNKTPRSEAQQQASRINGAKSQGPTTPDGKARSSKNAMTHGLRSATVVLANESQTRYDQLLAYYKDICRPVGQIEYDLVVSIVNARWRIRRIEAMSTAMLDAEMFICHDEINAAFSVVTPQFRQADAAMSLIRGLPMAPQYLDQAEERFTRIFHRSLNSLVKLQSLRLGHKPVFTFDETIEPEVDQNNCDDDEEFSYFSTYLAKLPYRQQPWTDPFAPPAPVFSDPPPPQHPAA